MRAYTIRRLLLVIPTLIMMSVIVFLLVRFLPGDVIDAMAKDMVFTEGTIDREALERTLGLDVPVYVQYGRWIRDIVLHGSLGESLVSRFSIKEKIVGRLPVTAQLGVMAIVIGLVIALPVGIYSAIRQDTAADYLGRSVAHYWPGNAELLDSTHGVLYPAIWWGWSPPLRLIPFTEDPLGNLGVFIIPSLIMARPCLPPPCG